MARDLCAKCYWGNPDNRSYLHARRRNAVEPTMVLTAAGPQPQMLPDRCDDRRAGTARCEYYEPCITAARAMR